jgi:hypothetical protein
MHVYICGGERETENNTSVKNIAPVAEKGAHAVFGMCEGVPEKLEREHACQDQICYEKYVLSARDKH